MDDPYWDPVFQRCQDDIELVRRIVRELPDRSLLGVIKPNPALNRRCAAFTRKSGFKQREPAEEAVAQWAETDAMLRRIILLEWVAGNPNTMTFPTLPPNEEAKTRLLAGEFGTPQQIDILARIDPREGARPLYTAVLAHFAARDALRQGDAGPGTGPEQRPEQVPGPGSARPPDRETLDRLNQENRDLRRGMDTAALTLRKLEGQIHALRQANGQLADDLAAARAEIDQVRRRLRKAEESALQTDLPKAAEQPPAFDETPFRMRVAELEEVINRKNGTIARLEQDLAEVREHRSQERTAETNLLALQQKLADREARVASLQRARVGRLVVAHAGNINHSALFEPIAGPPVSLSAKVTGLSELAEEEWAILLADPHGTPTEIQSLEQASRRVILGSIRHGHDGIWLDAEDDSFPVYGAGNDFADGSAARGIYLPDLADRPAGIFALRRLPTGEKPRAGDRLETATFAWLRDFFQLWRLDPEKLVNWLAEQGLTATREGERFCFPGDPKRLLAPLRNRLPSVPFCDQPECRHAASTHDFPRRRRSGEVCAACLRETGEQTSPDTTKSPVVFGGQRVLIVGGDYVGKQYCDVLSRFHLDVEWLSGFESLRGKRNGLAGIDAVVLILKQLSHTVLREIRLISNREGVPLVYSPQRGVSGVLTQLKKVFAHGHPP